MPSKENCQECHRDKPCVKHCPADHSHIRGRYCDVCNTYFRGDDMG